MEPEVPPWAETPWRAWLELQHDRPFATTGFAAPMGGMMIVAQPRPIPWALMQQWCDRAGCDLAMREFVVDMVRQVDQAFIEHWHRTQKSQARPSGMAEKLARWDASEIGEASEMAQPRANAEGISLFARDLRDAED